MPLPNTNSNIPQLPSNGQGFERLASMINGYWNNKYDRDSIDISNMLKPQIDGRPIDGFIITLLPVVHNASKEKEKDKWTEFQFTIHHNNLPSDIKTSFTNILNKKLTKEQQLPVSKLTLCINELNSQLTRAIQENKIDFKTPTPPPLNPNLSNRPLPPIPNQTTGLPKKDAKPKPAPPPRTSSFAQNQQGAAAAEYAVPESEEIKASPPPPPVRKSVSKFLKRNGELVEKPVAAPRRSVSEKPAAPTPAPRTRTTHPTADPLNRDGLKK